MNKEIHPHYPSEKEIDSWCESVLEHGINNPVKVEELEEGGEGTSPAYGVRHVDTKILKFNCDIADSFYGYWQPAPSGPAPLLVHIPGYGTEMSLHPQINTQGFNILHISPLGYCGPDGYQLDKQKNSQWPVLPDTVKSDAKDGYFNWLGQVVSATLWALSKDEVLDNRVSFFGTSQGGGTALLMGSIFSNRGIRCVAADVPFLTDFINAPRSSQAYLLAIKAREECEDESQAWHGTGMIDTLCHSHRMTFPVLLTAGSTDTTCTPESIENLFKILPDTRSYTLLKDVPHRYTKEFIPLATAWFRLYA